MSRCVETKPRNTTRCVETNEYGEQCVLVETHEPGLAKANDDYDLSYTHRTARSDEAYTWDGNPEACRAINCMRDRHHEGECRPSGWLAKKTAKPATPKSLHAPLQRPVPVTVQDKALTTALNFLSGLNLQDQRSAVQKEALAVIREIMDALKPDDPKRRKDL